MKKQRIWPWVLLVMLGMMLAIFFYLAGPIRVATLRSPSFQQALRERLQELVGTKLSVGEVIIADDKAFVLRDLVIGELNKEPFCHIPEISGKISSWGFGWRLSQLRLVKPACHLHYSADGRMLGFAPKLSFHPMDLRLLGGVSLDEVQVLAGTLRLLQMNDAGKSLHEIGMQNLQATASLSVGILGVNADLHLVDPAKQPLVLRFINAERTEMFAEFLGNIKFHLLGLQGVETEFTVSMQEQDLFPNLSSEQYPLRLSGKGSILFADEAQFSDVVLEIGQAARLDFATRFYYTNGMREFHVDVSKLRFLTTETFRQIWGFSSLSDDPLVTFSDGLIEATWDLNAVEDDFELVATTPELSFHLDKDQQASFQEVRWHLVTSSTGKGLAVPYKSKLTASKFRSDSHGIAVDEPYAAGEGALVDGTRIEFKQFALGTKNVDGVTVFSGFFETFAAKRDLKLEGEFYQKFDPFAFAAMDVSGHLRGPFSLAWERDQGITLTTDLEIQVNKLKAKALELENLTFTGPFRSAYNMNQRPAAPLASLSIFERYMSAFSQVDSTLNYQLQSLQWNLGEGAQYYAELKDTKGAISYHKDLATDATVKSQSKGTATAGALAIHRRDSDRVQLLRMIPAISAEWTGENLGKDRQVLLKNTSPQGHQTQFDLTFGDDWQIARTLMDGQAVDFQKLTAAPGTTP